MKKILFTLILIISLLFIFVSCTNLNLPKRIIHTLNLKIPGLTEKFELAPFATETAEASIVSVLPGFRFITEDGTALRLYYATQVSLGYDDIADTLEVDIQQLKDEASLTSISTSVKISFSDKLDNFTLPTIEASFTLPDFQTEGTSLTISFEKPEIDITLASETIHVNRIYVATETVKGLNFSNGNISDGVIIKGGTIDITATNTSDASFTISLKAENSDNVFAQSGEINIAGGDSPSGVSFRGGSSQVNLDIDDILGNDATITFIATALELPLEGGTLTLDLEIHDLEIQLNQTETASNTIPVIGGSPLRTTGAIFSIDTGLTEDATLTGGTLEIAAENNTDRAIETMTVNVTNDKGEIIAVLDLNNVATDTTGYQTTPFSTPNLIGDSASITVVATLTSPPATNGSITVTATFSGIQIQIANAADFNAETVEFGAAPDFGFNDLFSINELATNTGELSVDPATLTINIKGQPELEGLGLALDILLNETSEATFDIGMGQATGLIVDLSGMVFTRETTFTIVATPYLAPNNTHAFFEGDPEFEPFIDLKLFYGTDVILDSPINHSTVEVIETGLDSDFTFEHVTLNGDLDFTVDIQTLPLSEDYSATLTIKERFGNTVIATPVNNGNNLIDLTGKMISATDLELKFDFTTVDEPLNIDFNTEYDASVTADTHISLSEIASLTLKAEDSAQNIPAIDNLVSATFQSGELNIAIDSSAPEITQRLFTRGINLDTFKATVTSTVGDYLIEFIKTGEKYVADLAGVELTGDGATLTLGSLSLEFTEADALNLPEQIDITASMTNVVFSQVTVDVSEFYNDLMIEESESIDIPEEAKTYIKAIVLSGEPKIKIEWLNNTPMGLNLSANVSNGIFHENISLSNTGNQASTTWIIIPRIISIEGLDQINLNFEASPTGLDPVNRELILNNFTFDDLENYTIAATVTIKNFAEAVMPRGEEISIREVVLYGEVDEALFNFMRDQLPDFWTDYAGQIQIDEALTQAYVEIDENILSENPELKATLTIAGTPSGVVLSEIPINLDTETHFETNINDFLSNPSTDLSFGIVAHVDEATVNLDNVSEGATDLFSASVTVNIPVRFTVAEDIPLLTDTINLEEELNIELNDLDGVLNMIKAATGIVTAVNNSGISVKLELRWDSAAGEPIITNPQGGAVVTLTNGTTSEFIIALGSGVDAKDLLEKDIYARIVLPDSNEAFYTVMGDSAVDLSIYLDTVVKVEIPLESAR